MIAQVNQKGRLFVLECDALESANVSEEVGGGTKSKNLSVWHARLGHLSMKAMQNHIKCVEEFMMQDVSAVDNDREQICEGCVVGKSSAKPFPKSSYSELKTTLMF